jgi:hypothetical protein
MGLFTINLSNEDRQRVDRALNLVEEMKHIVTELVQGYELTIKVSLNPKAKTDDIQK